MTELLKLIKKSKTAKSGILTIVWGILILFGITGGGPPQTIDGMSKKQSSTNGTVIGLGAMASGLMTIKGRKDVENKVREIENEKS